MAASRLRDAHHASFIDSCVASGFLTADHELRWVINVRWSGSITVCVEGWLKVVWIWMYIIIYLNCYSPLSIASWHHMHHVKYHIVSRLLVRIEYGFEYGASNNHGFGPGRLRIVPQWYVIEIPNWNNGINCIKLTTKTHFFVYKCPLPTILEFAEKFLQFCHRHRQQVIVSSLVFLFSYTCERQALLSDGMYTTDTHFISIKVCTACVM